MTKKKAVAKKKQRGATESLKVLNILRQMEESTKKAKKLLRAKKPVVVKRLATKKPKKVSAKK